MAVIVVPGLFVFVAGALGGELFKGGGQVVICQARLVLGGSNPGGGTYIEDGYRAGTDAGFFDGIVDVGGDIDDVAVAFGFDFEPFCFDHKDMIGQ